MDPKELDRLAVLVQQGDNNAFRELYAITEKEVRIFIYSHIFLKGCSR